MSVIDDYRRMSTAFQHLTDFATYGNSYYWSSHRPEPNDVAVMLDAYRERRRELNSLKRDISAGRKTTHMLAQRIHELEIELKQRPLMFMVLEPRWRCRRRLQPLARWLVRPASREITQIAGDS